VQKYLIIGLERCSRYFTYGRLSSGAGLSINKEIHEEYGLLVCSNVWFRERPTFWKYTASIFKTTE
jgi:hypothetical protein